MSSFRIAQPGGSNRHALGRPPNILVVLDSSDAWARGALGGFARFAHQRDWVLFHYRKLDGRGLEESGLVPDAAILGPSFEGPWPAQFAQAVTVSVNVDRHRAEGHSVVLDWSKAVELAAGHLLARGYRHISSYRAGPWGGQREQHFRQVVAAGGARLAPGWQPPEQTVAASGQPPVAVMQWLLELPKPCGVLALCDIWARSLARYARAAGLRVPEDIALVGIDNDVFECEVESPPLSSVAVAWQDFGVAAAGLIQQSLNGERGPTEPVRIPPLDVVIRRSSDGLAIEDPLVAAAVRWIYQNHSASISVPMIAAAVRSNRQRLERHFRAAIGRTIVDEVRRTRVEVARNLLWTTKLSLVKVAHRSGFANASQLSVAFRREVGVPPGTYRKRAQVEALRYCDE